MFGGGSSESDWTLLRRPSPEERVREKLPVPIRASSTFSKHFEGPKSQVSKILCSSSHPASQAAAPASQACSPRSRLDTPERGHRGLELSKMKVERTPVSSPVESGEHSLTVSSTVPGDARENVASFHLPPFLPPPTSTRSMDAMYVNVKCRRRSFFVYVSISNASRAFKCQHSCGGYYYWS